MIRRATPAARRAALHRIAETDRALAQWRGRAPSRGGDRVVLALTDDGGDPVLADPEDVRQAFAEIVRDSVRSAINALRGRVD